MARTAPQDRRSNSETYDVNGRTGELLDLRPLRLHYGRSATSVFYWWRMAFEGFLKQCGGAVMRCGKASTVGQCRCYPTAVVLVNPPAPIDAAWCSAMQAHPAARSTPMRWRLRADGERAVLEDAGAGGGLRSNRQAGTVGSRESRSRRRIRLSAGPPPSRLPLGSPPMARFSLSAPAGCANSARINVPGRDAGRPRRTVTAIYAPVRSGNAGAYDVMTYVGA